MVIIPNAYLVERPKDSVMVTIMFNRADGKYHFVNLTHPHISSCAFDTIEKALADMDDQIKNGSVICYQKVNVELMAREQSELSQELHGYSRRTTNHIL